jgi:hypothetical protein
MAVDALDVNIGRDDADRRVGQGAPVAIPASWEDLRFPPIADPS